MIIKTTPDPSSWCLFKLSRLDNEVSERFEISHFEYKLLNLLCKIHWELLSGDYWGLLMMQKL